MTRRDFIFEVGEPHNRPQAAICAAKPLRERNMKSTTFARTLELILCTTLTISFQAAAQPTGSQSAAPPTYRYRAIDLGTLGGPDSAGCVPDCRDVNSQGTALFMANTPAPDPFQQVCPGCFATLGVRRQNGRDTTLNPIPGGVDTFALWMSDTNLVSGWSETGLLDPTTGFPEVTAVLWRSGVPISLGTFGGTSSAAWSVNDAGQVVGGAANSVPDSFANSFVDYDPFPFPVSTEVHAFLWSNGVLQDLQTLGGPDSSAEFVNESGQVAGVSFVNDTPNATTGLPTLDPFLWENGEMKDLGSLGGTLGWASGINNQGHVIGYSDLVGDATFHPFLWQAGRMIDLQTLGGNNGYSIWINDADRVVGWADETGNQVHHAFLWQDGKLTDLGTIGTDPCSTAYAINASGQVVGDSGDGSGVETCGPKSHGFLWEHGGPMVDLSTLFAPLASGLQFSGAGGISDGGEIAGIGYLPNGDYHYMLLVPCDANHEDAPACHASREDVAATSTMSAPPPVAAGIRRSPRKPHAW
jgi:probable HAF family extracellular repeat protein